MQTLALRKGGLLTDLSSTSTAEPTCVLPSKRSPGHRGRERKKQPLSHSHPTPHSHLLLPGHAGGEGSGGESTGPHTQVDVKSARRGDSQQGQHSSAGKAGEKPDATGMG